MQENLTLKIVLMKEQNISNSGSDTQICSLQLKTPSKTIPSQKFPQKYFRQSNFLQCGVIDPM